MTARSSRASAAGPQGAALKRVCVLIVNYNSGPWLARCIRALKAEGAPWPEVRVLDNASIDGSALTLTPMPGLEVIQSDKNLGFGLGINQLARNVDSEFLLILNPDCLLVAESLQRLVAELDAWPDVALVSGRVFDMHGKEQRGSRRQLPSPDRLRKEFFRPRSSGAVDLVHQSAPEKACVVEAVSGACILIRTHVFKDLGGFDARFPMHFEDLDLMARLGANGQQIRLVPNVVISHAGGVSSSHRPFRVEWNKHCGLWLYMNKHCSGRWFWLSRPLWAAAIAGHFLLRCPVVLWRGLTRSR